MQPLFCYQHENQTNYFDYKKQFLQFETDSSKVPQSVIFVVPIKSVVPLWYLFVVPMTSRRHNGSVS